MNILITGARGFIGKNLVAHLEQNETYNLFLCGREDGRPRLVDALSKADFVFHLAGVNRPETPEEFHISNTQLTEQICQQLSRGSRKPTIVLASSTQATLNNPYGRSKRQAEEAVRDYAEDGGSALIYRLPGVFGKWCRPNYNSVVATFCHNIARDLPVTISDPGHQLDLVYIDDVVEQLTQQIGKFDTGVATPTVEPVHQITLGDLAEQIHAFRASRHSLHSPSFVNPFVHKMYATYLSYLEEDDFSYQLEQRSDPRGSLAEFIKLPAFGQIFVSRTKPGITRGNHYHHTKTEKFLVLEGEAIVRFRAIDGTEVIEYPIVGSEYQVVDIPPGYTHSIENVGESELVTLFWASELFDPDHPDTYYIPVLETEDGQAQ